MSDNSFVSLFDALSDDEIEKNIIRLISQGFSDEEIVEQLIGLENKGV